MSRIAFIDLLFNWPPDGGARVDLKEVMSRLSRRHSVTLLVPDFQDYFPRGRIIGNFPFEIVKLPFTKRTFNSLTLPRVFRKALKKIKPDKLFIADGWYLKFPLADALRDYHPFLRFYAHEGLCIKDYGTQFRHGAICSRNYLGDTFECLCCALKHHRFRPLGIFSHEFLSALAFTPLYKRNVLRAIKGASAIIVYNDFMRTALAPINPRVVTIPSGVDSERFGTKPHTHNNGTSILMTSRTGDECKGFQVLREAVKILKGRGKNFRLIIPTYQSGIQGDDGIEYLPWCSQEDLPDLYARADICVVPSLWREPFGIAAVEAMAAGKPVVASRGGGLEGIVEDGSTGFLVEPGNAVELASKIETLLGDPILRRKMGSNARKKVEKNYDWDVIMKRYYKPLIESGTVRT
jgi:glycosyltransferase involved in cell wall biosynthesis